MTIFHAIYRKKERKRKKEREYMLQFCVPREEERVAEEQRQLVEGRERRQREQELSRQVNTK